MAESDILIVHGIVVEEETQLSLDELARACSADMQLLIALVDEGVLAPAGNEPPEWRFSGPSLRRALAALRLIHGLQLEPHAVAIVLDLLDKIDTLEARLRRSGQR